MFRPLLGKAYASLIQAAASSSNVFWKRGFLAKLAKTESPPVGQPDGQSSLRDVVEKGLLPLLGLLLNNSGDFSSSTGDCAMSAVVGVGGGSPAGGSPPNRGGKIALLPERFAVRGDSPSTDTDPTLVRKFLLSQPELTGFALSGRSCLFAAVGAAAGNSSSGAGSSGNSVAGVDWLISQYPGLLTMSDALGKSVLHEAVGRLEDRVFDGARAGVFHSDGRADGVLEVLRYFLAEENSRQELRKNCGARWGRGRKKKFYKTLRKDRGTERGKERFPSEKIDLDDSGEEPVTKKRKLNTGGAAGSWAAGFAASSRAPGKVGRPLARNETSLNRGAASSSAASTSFEQREESIREKLFLVENSENESSAPKRRRARRAPGCLAFDVFAKNHHAYWERENANLEQFVGYDKTSNPSTKQEPQSLNLALIDPLNGLEHNFHALEPLFSQSFWFDPRFENQLAELGRAARAARANEKTRSRSKEQEKAGAGAGGSARKGSAVTARKGSAGARKGSAGTTVGKGLDDYVRQRRTRGEAKKPSPKRREVKDRTWKEQQVVLQKAFGAVSAEELLNL